MQERADLFSLVQTITPQRFEAVAMQVFGYQAKHNPLYHKYLSLLGKTSDSVTSLDQIPFLPISFFKTHAVQSAQWTPQTTFTSSGTTGQIPSRHLIRDIDAYLENALHGFRSFYGDPAEWLVLALLPSYLERSGSSLVAMADYFIRRSRHSQSGFFLNNLDQLADVLQHRPAGVPVLLLGVSFALLDFAEQYPMDLSGVTIMETGGMKGRREEMIRPEVHRLLKNAFGDMPVHSEYGMTELLSQAYSKGDGIFACPPWMKVLVRDEEDPLLIKTQGSGVINIIDLANIYSCSFIATDDAGKLNTDGSFEVIGRIDGSDLRGCSLMVAI